MFSWPGTVAYENFLSSTSPLPINQAARFAEYQVQMLSDGTASPVLSDISLNYVPEPAGALTFTFVDFYPCKSNIGNTPVRVKVKVTDQNGAPVNDATVQVIAPSAIAGSLTWITGSQGLYGDGSTCWISGNIVGDQTIAVVATKSEYEDGQAVMYTGFQPRCTSCP